MGKSPLKIYLFLESHKILVGLPVLTMRHRDSSTFEYLLKITPNTKRTTHTHNIDKIKDVCRELGK